jgi:RNA polymerase sigma-70 factor (ECF subfamily)
MDPMNIETEKPAIAGVPDSILISRILAGEKKLFEQIIRRYNQRIFRIGMSVLGNEAETEDAMQNTYINAYQHLAAFEGRSSFATWITRIMLNECLGQKKKKQRYPAAMDNDLLNSVSMATPEYLYKNKELSGILEDVITRLPEKYRLVFILREVEEISVRDVSDLLNIGETNVKVRLNRAKIMLREKLNGYIKGSVYNYHLSRCDRMVNQVMNRLDIH